MSYPLPYQLLASLSTVKGFDKELFEAVHQSGEKLTSVRINPDKITDVAELEYETESIPWCRDGYYLNHRPMFTFNPLLHAGGFYVQEASSMFIWHILESLGIAKNGYVLDLCAAPGGKSTLLSTYFKEGMVVCNEVIQNRAAILVENMVKWGNDNTVVTNNDPKHFSDCFELFDVIVLDAPCSGSGMFRKDNDAIGEWSEDNVALCSQRQERIIMDIMPCLKKGGLIIYSTCSYSQEEDEDIADFILTEQEGLVSEKIEIKDEWNTVETISDKKGAYGYRFFPDKVKGEGFFVAAFRKNDSNSYAGNSWVRPLRENKKDAVAKAEMEALSNFITLPDEYEYIKNRESILALPVAHIQFIRLILSKLYIKRVGIELGIIKGKDCIPSHHLAMSRLSGYYPNKVEVDKEVALEYQRKKDINIEAVKGWSLVTYKKLPLGWIKALPNRINNYYPTEWRIIKQ